LKKVIVAVCALFLLLFYRQKERVREDGPDQVAYYYDDETFIPFAMAPDNDDNLWISQDGIEWVQVGRDY